MGWTHEKEYFVCSTYRKKKGGCSSHQIRNVVIEKLLLEQIHAVTEMARTKPDEFISFVSDLQAKELTERLRESKKEYESAMARINKLDSIIQRLYEDNLEGKISDERFRKMTESYEDEQTQLNTRVTQLKELMEKAKNRTDSAGRFLALVERCTDVDELDPEIIRTLINRIVVHNADKSGGRRRQQIDVEFNFIGKVILPESEKTA